MPKTKPPIIYVDTCVYIDLLTHNETPHPELGEPRWKIAKKLFDAVNNDRITLAASALVEVEVCGLGPVRDGAEKVIEMVRGWFDANATLWTDVDRPLARDSAGLAREWHSKRANNTKQLRGPDATHLAAALRLGCDYLMTHDEGFPLGQTVKSVKVQRPTQVWTPDLFDTVDS
jgi:predicted nucleic acid-binding protein